MLIWSSWERETQSVSTWPNPSLTWRWEERIGYKTGQNRLEGYDAGRGFSFVVLRDVSVSVAVVTAVEVCCGCQMMLEWSGFSMGASSTVCSKSMRAPKGLF